MIGRALILWVVIAGLEVIQGILRMRFLNPAVGDRRARQVGVVTGSIMILVIAFLFGPWVGYRTPTEALQVGGLWLVLMLVLDVGVGRLLFRMPWSRIGRDFHPGRGGWLAFGMLVLLLAPWISLWGANP